MKTEIELLTLGANNHEQKYKIIDNKIITEFESHTNEQLLQNITKLWMDDCDLEEIISLQRWENDIKFFLSYETTFKRLHLRQPLPEKI